MIMAGHPKLTEHSASSPKTKIYKYERSQDKNRAGQSNQMM